MRATRGAAALALTTLTMVLAAPSVQALPKLTEGR